MKFIVHANSVDWQREYLPRFCAGFTVHDIPVHHTTEDNADPSGINIIFANNSWKKTEAQCIRRDIPLITVGRCFFGSRFDSVAIGWDGFNGAADFCVGDTMPTKDHPTVPGIAWNPEGHVVVCGEFREMGQWCEELKTVLKGEDVVFRSHPFKNDVVKGWRTIPAGQDNIEVVLNGAKACITYDSIAGCDAVFAGVPSITYGENAMARDVSWHSWKELPKNFSDFMMQAQHKPLDIWANRLAYCQWTHAEIESGEFWNHLKQGAETRVGKTIKRDIFR